MSEELEVISQWEFIDRIPTGSDVVELLGTLPDWFGVRYEDLADYVQGLPSTKKQKIKVRTKTGNVRQEEKFFDVVTLYMSVAGRLQMVNRAADLNGWMVDFQPEPVTPTGVPGFLQMDDRLVYREYCVIRALSSDDGGRWEAGDMLGMKPGMAWVPSTGGRQAAGSNPYEKVETAARGRSLAAWGVGVLPGSGVASLDEMLGVQGRQVADVEAKPRKSREQLIEEVGVLSEEIRQLRGYEHEEQLERLGEYLTRSFGIADPIVDDAVDWSKVKDGQIQLTANQLSASRKSLIDQESAV